MKKVSALFVIIAILFSTIALAADSTKVQARTAKATKVAKPTWGMNLAKADFDSTRVKYAVFADSENVNLTWGELREILNLAHDQTLRDGDKRFVNMPGMYKHQVTKKIGAKFSALSKDVAVTANAVATKLTELNGAVNDVAYFAKGLDQSIANIQLVVTKDETPVTVGAEKTIPAKDMAMELIKKEVAVRRAAAMTPFDSSK